ncbi:alpha/beta hydrolase [Dyadobacter psychrotolerans]|uniref:Alpha/beta hydrolase n=1 Tax=Dyadobacter psychrotolerans TaxID=2541721 RepID=A0A4R5DVU3_9BACT|nr:alpha/beta hydrolase-fold protein [Dyadobacter psychrotolerans]TDE18589.1 alpha/beta hydrolase [Dyadobacter psychrotolerans]
MQVAIDTLRIELKTPPTDKRPVYITGNFCKWLPDLEKYKMEEDAVGHYSFQFPADLELPYPLEYKYTRGGWDQMELDNYGQPQGNRVIDPNEGIVKDFVTRWETDSTEKASLSPIIEVLSETFEIPQLNKKRRVHMLLPHDYYENPDRHYPVLYMTDAQNLFGEGSPYGNWEIDKSLTKLAGEDKANVIIVAIDHAGEERIQEFSPYDNPRLGKGLGLQFLRFVKDTLKPFVDKEYRTKPDRLNTGMGGSSVGGLLAIYAALMFPDVFGRLMIFSPSLWISQRIYFDAIHFFEPFETRIYIYAGGKEGANMIPNVNKLQETLRGQGFGYSRVKINTSIDPKGKHNEKRWSEEFPLALKWLFFE